MVVHVTIFAVLLLSGFCNAGPATVAAKKGICWAVGDPNYRTFDGSMYNFMGNCTYVMTKNCFVDATHPAFEVDARNINIVDTNLTTVGAVAVSVYGTTINIVQFEYGVVRVNNQQWNLPINLANGKVKLTQSGFSVVLETDFGLTVRYNWQQYLVIAVPASFAGKVCGLCGNFNSHQEDDLTTPSGAFAKDPQDMGKSWRVPGIVEDAYCRDECTGPCQDCKLSDVKQLEYQIVCNSLSKVMERYFQGCAPLIDPQDFLRNCMFELCKGAPMKEYFCDTLQIYSDSCQRAGVPGQVWRDIANCPPPKCPENSHYERCGPACQATCQDPSAATSCAASCVETCACNQGLVLSGRRCVPEAQCGCTYEGRYVESGASFWGEDGCTERYACSDGGRLTSEKTGCPPGQQCQVAEAVKGCYPVKYATCMVSGDPHFVTFDGERYNFQGTCAYELAGVTSSQKTLEDFSVILQNYSRDNRTGSVVGLVEVNVYGNRISISKELPGFVTVNGERSILPMTLNSTKLQMYNSGWFAVLHTEFGLNVYYDWSSIALVTVPSTYEGSMLGMCGNYNLDPKDDMRTRNGNDAANAEKLGQSWKVSGAPGCVDGYTGPCPGCTGTQKNRYGSSAYCGLIGDPAGPFRDCHPAVDPASFLEGCLHDVCLYRGSGSMQCEALTAYTAACQLKGAKVYPWRSAQLCDAQCPANGHYEICSSGCQKSCQNGIASSGCGARCMEGCVCNEGFLLSGNECVHPDQCGCPYNSKYYKHGQVFYPDALCQQECVCNGTVQCKKSSCGPNERCEVKRGVRSCQPFGKGVCSISGDPHYNTFDNSTYDFQGTCTYTAAEACHLQSSGLTGFSVAVENERWYAMSTNPKVSVAKLVSVTVYDNTLILRENQIGMIMLNGVMTTIPLNINNKQVQVYQDGNNYVILTDFGLRVTYDMIYHVTVTVPGNYRGHTCGLCGNFNGDKTDDYQLPGGNVTDDLLTFGEAWKVAVPGVVCEDGCSGDLCPKCDASKKEAFEKDCQVIADPRGPFAACHSVIDPASYYRDCVYDTCMSTGDRTMFCHSVSAYMLDCQDFGVKILNWRTPGFCPISCPANSHYETCGHSCDSPCPGLAEVIPCHNTCTEACGCDTGYYYNGTGCVSLDQCSCYSNGNAYKIGESVTSDDCRVILVCHAPGVVVSRNTSCKSAESCQVKNGVRGCYPTQCSLTANGTLTPFSGETGSITEPGAFEIIQVCEPSQTLPWFRVVAKLETCGTPVGNTVVALYVYLNDLSFTITNKHAVWVNGKAMAGITFNRSDVTVMTSDRTVAIESDGLRLSFSAFNEVTLSVGDRVADHVCGACGRLGPIGDPPEQMPLGERLLASLRGQAATLVSLDEGKWKAPDFPQCDV